MPQVHQLTKNLRGGWQVPLGGAGAASRIGRAIVAYIHEYDSTHLTRMPQSHTLGL